MLAFSSFLFFFFFWASSLFRPKKKKKRKKTELKARIEIEKGFKFRNLAGRRLKCCQSSSSKPGRLTSSQSNSWSLLRTSLKTSSLCLSCRFFLGDDEASICLLPQLSLSSIAIKESICVCVSLSLSVQQPSQNLSSSFNNRKNPTKSTK